MIKNTPLRTESKPLSFSSTSLATLPNLSMTKPKRLAVTTSPSHGKVQRPIFIHGKETPESFLSLTEGIMRHILERML